MRWIEDKAEYQKIRLLARDCALIDSEREPTKMTKLYFTDLTALAKMFPPLLEDLFARSGDESCMYIVLDPDPEYFWHDRLDGFPVFEFERTDPSDDYFKYLNRPFGDNPGNNMMDMWSCYAIFPMSLNWFVHAMRSHHDDTAHLWTPPQWRMDLAGKFPFLHIEPNFRE